MDELGRRIRRLREAQHLGLNALARAADIDAGQLSRIETGQAKRPGHRTLAHLAAALQVPLAELTGEAEPELLTAGEAFARAYRWAGLAAELADVDVESLLRTLVLLSPEGRAALLAEARRLGQAEYVAGRGPQPARVFQEPQAATPRVLGEAPPPEAERAAG